MGWIKEFNDLPLPVKAIVISLTVVLPFWFIFLYLYYHQIADYPWYVILAFCFPPAFGWYVLSVFQHTIIAKITNRGYTHISKDKAFWISVAADTIVNIRRYC